MVAAIQVCVPTSILSATALVIALTLSGVASLAQADDYKRDPQTKGLESWNKVLATKEANEVKNLVQGVGGVTLAGNENMLVSFLNDAFFPLFTQPENAIGATGHGVPGKIGLAKMHSNFKIQYLMASANAKQAGVHEVLNRVTMNKMKEIVKDNYHPAVRYQAMLMLGDLHEVEPQGRSAGVLLPAALPLLLAGAKKQDLPYEVRAAALVGVQKHAGQSGAAAGAAGSKRKQEIAEAMKAVLAEKTPPEGRTQEQQDWLRQAAADVMTTIREPIPDDLKMTPKTAGPTDTAAK